MVRPLRTTSILVYLRKLRTDWQQSIYHQVSRLRRNWQLKSTTGCRTTPWGHWGQGKSVTRPLVLHTQPSSEPSGGGLIWALRNDSPGNVEGLLKHGAKGRLSSSRILCLPICTFLDSSEALHVPQEFSGLIHSHRLWYRWEFHGPEPGQPTPTPDPAEAVSILCSWWNLLSQVNQQTPPLTFFLSALSSLLASQTLSQDPRPGADGLPSPEGLCCPEGKTQWKWVWHVTRKNTVWRSWSCSSVLLQLFIC